MKKFIMLLSGILFSIIAHGSTYKYTGATTNGILVSNDISQWQYIDLSKDIVLQHTSQVTFKDIAYGNDIFVIVGTYGLTASSNDQVHWSTNYISQAASSSLNSIVFYHGKFYANSTSAIYSSSDAVTWTTVATIDHLNKLSIANDTLYALCSEKVLSLGQFGWTTLYQEQNSPGFRTISYGNGMYLINTSSGLSSLTSIDGVTWVSHPTNRGYGPDGIASIYVDKFIALYFLDNCQTDNQYGSLSYDGLTWILDTMTVNGSQGSNGFINFIIYDGETYIAGGAKNSVTLYLSADGINWYLSSSIPKVNGSLLNMVIVN